MADDPTATAANQPQKVTANDLNRLIGDPTAPLYSFSSGSAGWFSTVWQIRRLRDGHVAMSGRTFGRRHEQRAWKQMQHVARRYGYAD